jgi:hypothetical protein
VYLQNAVFWTLSSGLRFIAPGKPRIYPKVKVFMGLKFLCCAASLVAFMIMDHCQMGELTGHIMAQKTLFWSISHSDNVAGFTCKKLQEMMQGMCCSSIWTSIVLRECFVLSTACMFPVAVVSPFMARLVPRERRASYDCSAEI